MNDESAWESAMSRDFDARVRNLHESPLSLDDVRGKAGSIRRRRRAAAVGGVLAAAAIVVPGALLAGLPGNDDSGPGPVDNPPDAVDETGVEYLAGDVWHRQDGSQVVLPGSDYASATRWDDKLVVQRFREDGSGSQVDVVDQDGTVVDSFDATAGVVVNDAGTTMAWLNDDGDIVTRNADSEYVIPTDGAEVDQLRAITGGPDCDPAADGCRVYTGDVVRGSDGTVGQPQGRGKFGVNDASEHGYTRTEEITDTSSCGGFYSYDGNRQWGTCDHTLVDVSPGGDYVLGTDDYLDGFGQSFAAILDSATGEELARYEAGRDRALVAYGWADDSHLVIDAYDYAEGQWHLLLLGTDGTVTEVTDPAPGNDLDDNPFTPIRR